jgi:putative membrane protein
LERHVKRTNLLFGLLAWYGLLWIVLAIAPRDRQDWFLENLLALSAVATLIATYRRFQFSTTSYLLMTAFFSFHAIGAHYTYAQVPFGFWLQEGFDLSRNPFDRLVHFAFGLLLAYPLRELLIRLAGVRGLWSFYLPVSGMLAQSGLFEIVEAVVAQIVRPELGAAYLGTQGDEWDAQKDMLAAFSGACLCMTVVFMSAGGGRKGDFGSGGEMGRPV